jgi:hypothetical protein
MNELLTMFHTQSIALSSVFAIYFVLIEIPVSGPVHTSGPLLCFTDTNKNQQYLGSLLHE